MSDTLASILKQAEAHGILQRKVVKGGETEYLPTHPGEAGTANKGLAWISHPPGVEHLTATEPQEYTLTSTGGEWAWLTAEKQHTGAMLALYPDTPPEFTLADADLEPTAPDELHVTMAYLGDAADLDEEDRAFLRRVCEQIASEFNPIQAKLGGIGRFLNLEDDDTQAYYANVDSPDIEALRARIMQVLGALGMLPKSDHGFTPHMTLAYVPVGKPAMGAGLQEEPVEFGGLSLSLAGERERFPFRVSGEKFSASQPRDEAGRFAESGGGGGVPVQESPGGRAPAGGIVGMNGLFYPGGSFLPSTKLGKQPPSAQGTVPKKPRKAPVARGVWEEAPTPTAQSIFGTFGGSWLNDNRKTGKLERNEEFIKYALKNEADRVNPEMHFQGKYFGRLNNIVSAYNDQGVRWIEPLEEKKSAVKQNIMLTYPDESKTQRFVWQQHFRGKSSHGDFRVQSGDYLVGWTIPDQNPGAITEPVETLAQATSAVNNPDLWKMNLATGEIKPREIRSGVVRKGDLRALPKGVEIPEDWLNEQGVTDKPDPGEAIPVGATRNFPGVFKIVDRGTVEHGAKKPWLAEYWIHGDKWGTQRWLFRLLERGKGDGLQAEGWEEEAEKVGAKYDPGQPRNEAGQFAGGFGASEPPHWASNEGQIVEGYTVFKGKYAAKNDYAVVTDDGQPGPFRKTPEEAVSAHEQVLDKTRDFARAHAEYKGALTKVKDGDMSQWRPLMGGERVTTSHAKFVLRDLGVSTKVRDKIVYGTPVIHESKFGTVYYDTEVMGERYQRLALGQGKSLKQDTLPPGVIEQQPRSDVFWVFMQPDDQTPYVLGKEAIDKDWLPPKGVSALPKAIRERVPKELRYWEVSGKEALDRRAKLAEMDVRELGGSSAKYSPNQPRDESGRFGSGGGANLGEPNRETSSVRATEKAKTGERFSAELYRGTGQSASEAARNRTPSQYAIGEYWSPYPEVAETYGPKVSQNKLTLENPYVFKLPGKKPYFTELQSEFGTRKPEEITRKLKSQGHDGLIVKNVPVNRFSTRTNEPVAFSDSIEVIAFKEFHEEKQFDWKPYYLQRHWFRGPIQVRFGASDQHYDLRVVLNGKHWHLVIDGNPLTNDRLPAYEETKYSGNVATADGKKINVLRIGTDPIELAPGQPANPTKDTPAFIQTVDEGEARLIDDQPEFKKVEFKGGKLRGAWYFRLESAGSLIGEFGKSEGPAVKTGEKYDPGQARDEAGRFSSGGGYSFNFGEGRTREHRGLPRDYVNQLDGGPGPSVQYHGTSNRNATFSDAEVVYLQDKPTEAAGYARDLHRLGTPPKGGVQQREVLAIRRKPGYTVSIDEEVSKAVDEGDDVDSVINAAASRAKEHGFRYVYFEHPTFSGEGQERVLVSLYPKSDLQVVREQRLKKAYGEKGVRPLFGSPGGKRLLAKTIVDLIPPHKVYVEPFAGGAAVLFAKPPEMSEKEVLADADPDIAFAYRTVKGLSDAEIERLNGMEWRIGKFDEVKDSRPEGELGKLHRWLFLRKHSQGHLGGNQASGETARSGSSYTGSKAERLPLVRDRLASAQVRHADYKTSLKEWDGKDTFFYLDPPYPESNLGAAKTDLRWSDEDCAAFAKALKSLKGKWLVSLQDNQTNRDLFKGYSIRTVTVPTVFNTGGGKGNDRRELLIANYPLPKRVRRKSMDDVEALQLVYTCMGCKGEFESEVVLEEPVCPDCAANWSEAEKFRASQPRDDSGRFASTGLESAEGFSGSLPKDLSKASPKQKRAVVKYLANKPLKELRKRQELVRKQTKLAYDQRNDLALSNLQEMDRHLSAAVDLQQFNKSIDAKALPWQPYLLQRHNDHHDLRIGDDFTLRLSGTLLDNEPDKAEVSTESPTLQGAGGQAVDALKVKPGDPVKLADGEIQTLDKGQARYAKTQAGHQVEFKGGKLEGVYLFGEEGAHPVDLEHIDVEWEPGEPAPAKPGLEPFHPPLIPIHPPLINPDLIRPLNPAPPNIPGNLPPPGQWWMGDGEVAEGEKVGKRIKTEKLSKLQELRNSLESAVKWLGEVIGWASYQDAPEPTMLEFFKGSDAGFTVKTVQGEPWLFTWSANAFKDREGEIFSTKALENWADAATSRQDKGTFNFWHIPGSDFAVKRWVGVPGRILVEAGPFTKDAKGLAAQKFFAAFPDRHPTLAPEGWGCSVEYRYLPEERKEKVYQNVEITRTSVLPRFAAANTWTAVKEVAMLTDKQREAAKEVFGEALAASILGGAEKATKELEANVDHKGEGEQTEPEVQPEVQPEAAQAEAQPDAEDDKAKKKPKDAAMADGEPYPKPTKAEKKQLDQFVKAIRDVAASVTDDSPGRTAILEVADKLSEENLKDMASELKKAGKAVKNAAQKARLTKLVEAMAGDGTYPAPGEGDGEAYPYPTKSKEFVEAVAAELAPQFKVDMAPIGEAMTQLAAAVKGMEDRITALETQSGRKAATDLPRFVFGLVEQASKADATIVPEGDKLLEQKPKETSRADVDGSIAAHFFPKGK